MELKFIKQQPQLNLPKQHYQSHHNGIEIPESLLISTCDIHNYQSHHNGIEMQKQEQGKPRRNYQSHHNGIEILTSIGYEKTYQSHHNGIEIETRNG